MRLFGIFRRNKKADEQPLRIEGISDGPMTPEPDDAELAAQALLEIMASADGKVRKNVAEAGAATGGAPQDAVFYRKLAEKIRMAHEAARLRTMRFLFFCEERLALPTLPVEGPDSLSLLEQELYKRIDVVEREGGELKRRWQHCLAEVTVRLMNTTPVSEDRQKAHKS